MNDLQGCEVTFFTSFFFFLPLPIAAAKVSAEAPFGALRSAGCAGALRAPGTNPLNPKMRAPNPRALTPTQVLLPLEVLLPVFWR